MSSTGSQKPEDYYADLLRAIEQLGSDWAIAGAWAAFEYRDKERRTKDSDFLVSWRPGLIELIEAHGFETRAAHDPGDDPHLIRARRDADVVDFLVALTPYQQEALRRAQDNVLTVEDVLVHKIIAWRGRDRDDIESILRVGHEIDWEYVERWVAYFGFEDPISKIER